MNSKFSLSFFPKYPRQLVCCATATAVLLFTLRPIASATIPEGDPIVGTNETLLVNDNFQAKDADGRPLRWIFVSPKRATGLDVVVSQEQKHGAEAEDSSMKIMDNSAADTANIRSEKRLAVPGLTYQVTAWVKGSSGTPASLYLEFWDVNNARIAYTSTAPGFSTSWQQVSLTLAAPANTMYVTVSMSGLTASTGISYWDDVVLKPTVTYNPAVATGVRELFLDDYRLESTFDVERVVQEPVEKQGPLLSRTESWEGEFLSMTGTVLKGTLIGGGTGYRMWYYSGGRTLYAQSTDGINWTKPNLGSYTYSGSTANNIAFPPGQGRLTLVYDDADVASKRYKALVHDVPNTLGYFYYSSPTGIDQWTAGNSGNAVLPYGDLSNVAYHQTAPGVAGTFIAATKQRTSDSDTMASFANDRIAFVSTSTNFVGWTQPGGGDQFVAAVESDQADDFAAQSRRAIEGQIYSMSIYPYASVYIGFPWVLEITDYSTGIFWKASNGPVTPQLAVSRDLKIWSRPSRTPVIPRGKPGAWDDGAIYTASTLITDAANGQMHVYYSGGSLGHGSTVPAAGNKGADPNIPAGKDVACHIGRATWRLDGFASMHNAGDEEGYVQTKPLTFTGATKLRVNAKLNTGGSLKVEVLNASGTPISNFTYAQATAMTGDQLNALAAWAGGNNISSLAGTSIKLKFYLKGGDLFSYWFE